MIIKQSTNTFNYQIRNGSTVNTGPTYHKKNQENSLHIKYTLNRIYPTGIANFTRSFTLQLQEGYWAGSLYASLTCNLITGPWEMQL